MLDLIPMVKTGILDCANCGEVKAIIDRDLKWGQLAPCPSCHKPMPFIPSAPNLLTDSIEMRVEGSNFTSRHKLESWAKETGRKFEEPGLNKDAKRKKAYKAEANKAAINEKIQELIGRSNAPT